RGEGGVPTARLASFVSRSRAARVVVVIAVSVRRPPPMEDGMRAPRQVETSSVLVVLVVVLRAVGKPRAFRDLRDALLHEAADPELHDSFRWDVDLLERARVLRLPRRALLDLEHAELAELEAIAAAELLDDLVEEELDHV